MTSIAWILVKATLVLLAGLLASAAARKSPASVRHLILASTFVALLILPMVATMATPNVVLVSALPSAINARTTPPRIEPAQPEAQELTAAPRCPTA